MKLLKSMMYTLFIAFVLQNHACQLEFQDDQSITTSSQDLFFLESDTEILTYFQAINTVSMNYLAANCRGRGLGCCKGKHRHNRNACKNCCRASHDTNLARNGCISICRGG